MIQTEATEQTYLLHRIDKDMDSTLNSIEGSTQQAAQANAQSRKGYCWLYVIIFIELYILVTILMKYA